MTKLSEQEQQIAAYYDTTENSYIDGWDLNNSLALHFGYTDETTKSFGSTLLRMNEILMQVAGVKPTDKVLDAGCGVGGSSFYLSQKTGCSCIGISLTEKQVAKANALAKEKGLEHEVHFMVMNFENTVFPDRTFDVVWGLESICYAEDKERFVREAYRLLKSGGRLVIADGMVSKYENNEHPIIKNWLKGWMVPHLESPDTFKKFFTHAGFKHVKFSDITKNVMPSSKRLNWLYKANKLWAAWKKMTFRYKWNKIQQGNIEACKWQYKGLKQGLWIYGIIVGTKQD